MGCGFWRCWWCARPRNAPKAGQVTGRRQAWWLSLSVLSGFGLRKSVRQSELVASRQLKLTICDAVDQAYRDSEDESPA
ncbi:hypothetical protein SODALDRAFT_68346 [Sodiomyces alkalinus F11]|uniref:Uncharacterized protein n=1 Tax=Sodiomyces alkalinus (strain CBS 110278 / VKM F-3762 / F11) TaxID=1314773 RepID=A0A3N2PLV8_SODAK|nr:hypothetical protein SODALDRAFT_68346 [Sodiomyces alkalinus F11]ROT35507.1 hypothetical protein SODALDRAFT_68346 [Sodiomyces alkalinus F11]